MTLWAGLPPAVPAWPGPALASPADWPPPSSWLRHHSETGQVTLAQLSHCTALAAVHWNTASNRLAVEEEEKEEQEEQEEEQEDWRRRRRKRRAGGVGGR